MADETQEVDEELSATRLALRALAALRPSLDRLEAALVDRARIEHVSWELIAADLGTTKQTAHRRHASHVPPTKRRRRWRVPPEAERLATAMGDEERLLELLEQATQGSPPAERGQQRSSGLRDDV